LDKLWRKLRNTGSTRRRRGSGPTAQCAQR